MLKKTIAYIDFDGAARTDICYFNLSKSELAEFDAEYSGGISAAMERIVENEDRAGMIKFIKNFITKAFGVKSQDGRRFIKIDENGRSLAADFVQTNAYDALFVELLSDETGNAITEFVKGVIPQNN